MSEDEKWLNRILTLESKLKEAEAREAALTKKVSDLAWEIADLTDNLLLSERREHVHIREIESLKAREARLRGALTEIVTGLHGDDEDFGARVVGIAEAALSEPSPSPKETL